VRTRCSWEPVKPAATPDRPVCDRPAYQNASSDGLPVRAQDVQIQRLHVVGVDVAQKLRRAEEGGLHLLDGHAVLDGRGPRRPLVATLGPGWVSPPGQVSHYGYGQIFAVLGEILLAGLAVLVGFLIAQLTAAVVRRRAPAGV
jgi:hypothetical protein